MAETKGPAIDRSIYVMPMFANFAVSDFAASEALYASAGFVNLATIPGPGGGGESRHSFICGGRNTRTSS